MGALDDEDAVQFEAVAEWTLPVDRDGFLGWLKEADVDLETFKTYPVWLLAPESLVKQLD